MASKRDKLRQLNQRNHEPKDSEATTIVDELVKNYDEGESKEKTSIQDEPKQQTPVEAKIPSAQENPIPKTTPIVSVIDKSKVGRPKILEGVYKPISARLKMENYEFVRINGGKYGGMNGYLNYLIEQEMNKTSGN